MISLLTMVMVIVMVMVTLTAAMGCKGRKGFSARLPSRHGWCREWRKMSIERVIRIKRIKRKIRRIIMMMVRFVFYL